MDEYIGGRPVSWPSIARMGCSRVMLYMAGIYKDFTYCGPFVSVPGKSISAVRVRWE